LSNVDRARGGTFTFFLLSEKKVKDFPFLSCRERKVESELTFLSFLEESESATLSRGLCVKPPRGVRLKKLTSCFQTPYV
jgi:hypothetical protein